jgi:hypothetical protein
VSSNAITKIDGMKIDIEGAEMEAFEGMHQIFERCPPQFVICELMPGGVASRADSAARPTEIIDFMARKGYLACLLGLDGLLQLAPLTGAAVENSPHIVNVIFAHEQLRRVRPELFSVG